MSATRQPRAVLAAVLVLLQAQPSTSIRRGDLFGLRRRERQLHWHHDWEEGMRHSLRWYKADWVASITDFFCDPSCQERIKRANTEALHQAVFQYYLINGLALGLLGGLVASAPYFFCRE